MGVLPDIYNGKAPSKDIDTHPNDTIAKPSFAFICLSRLLFLVRPKPIAPVIRIVIKKLFYPLDLYTEI